MEPSLFSEASYFLGFCDSTMYFVSSSFLVFFLCPLSLINMSFFLSESTWLLTGNSKWWFPNRIHVFLILNCCPDSLPHATEKPFNGPFTWGTSLKQSSNGSNFKIRSETAFCILINTTPDWGIFNHESYIWFSLSLVISLYSSTVISLKGKSIIL